MSTLRAFSVWAAIDTLAIRNIGQDACLLLAMVVAVGVVVVGVSLALGRRDLI